MQGGVSSGVQKYSFPPNNTPVSKVYVFGRPVYVRQPFVVPQRGYRPRHDSHVMRDERSFQGNADALADAVEQTVVQEAMVKQFFTDTDPLRYQLPERPFPPSDRYGPIPAPVEPKHRYPLPQCYTNDSGKAERKSAKIRAHYFYFIKCETSNVVVV
ncbi:unnamed protein product [Strongylus vulgaris]|uniref:Zasp-like motif domain-containing protein n=1 Tax=Strongylus vulgaris TaxID=40348 RepID=A0A3P7IYM2_STRVU|nr:unnamed protein product [Strongylus vulgaris]